MRALNLRQCYPTEISQPATFPNCIKPNTSTYKYTNTICVTNVQMQQTQILRAWNLCQHYPTKILPAETFPHWLPTNTNTQMQQI